MTHNASKRSSTRPKSAAARASVIDFPESLRFGITRVLWGQVMRATGGNRKRIDALVTEAIEEKLAHECDPTAA